VREYKPGHRGAEPVPRTVRPPVVAEGVSLAPVVAAERVSQGATAEEVALALLPQAREIIQNSVTWICPESPFQPISRWHVNQSAEGGLSGLFH
jgi:hypothetical protein